MSEPALISGLDRVEQPAVRRVEPGLGDGAHRAHAVVVVGEAPRRPPPASGVGPAGASTPAVITPSVPSEPRNIRSGDGPAPEPGKPAGLDDAGGGDDAQRLREVVDVGEHAWRSGRRPWSRASRRAWRTRRTAGRTAGCSPLRPELLLQVRARARRPAPARPGWSGRSPAPGSSTPRSRLTAAGVLVADSGLDPADHRRAAAERDRRRSGRRCTSRGPGRPRPRWWGGRPGQGRESSRPSSARTTSRKARPWLCASRSIGSSDVSAASASRRPDPARGHPERLDRRSLVRLRGRRSGASPRPARSAAGAPHRSPRPRRCPSPTTTASCPGMRMRRLRRAGAGSGRSAAP